MTSRLEKLSAASFKGVPFLVTSESLTEAGRKISLHEYPNSSNRFVEDLGQIPDRFRIQAFVTGDTWINDAKALENALNSKGPGSLVMPTFGSLNMYALPYSKDASQSSVGIISFNIEFAAGKPANSPAKAAATETQVFALGDNSRAEIQAAFIEDYKEPSFIDSIKVAIGDVKDSAAEVLKNIADKIDVETLQKINAKVQEIAVKAPSLISDPSTMAQDLIQGVSNDPGVWQLASLGFGSSGAISSFNILSDYGESLLTSDSSDDVLGSSVDQNDDDETSNVTPYWSVTTDDREKRNNLRRLLVRNNRLNALVCMYEQAAVAEYSTESDLQTARDTVESRYEEIMLVGTDNDNALQSNQAVRLAINAVRSASLEVLTQKNQETFGTVTISQRASTSQFVLGYNLYAEEFTNSEDLTDRCIVIRSLNPDQNGISMSGNLSVLQSEGS